MDIRWAYGIVHRNIHGDYQEYLQSDQWKRIREAVLERDKYTCQRCDAVWTPNQQPFHVHHWTYERRGNEKLEDLGTLCPKCHGVVHNIQDAA